MCPPAYSARFCTGPARVFVQGLRIVAQAAAPLCVGFPRCGRRVGGRWVRGCRGLCFLFGSGECLRFSVSGVGAGVGPCVFGCWLALLPGLALFGCLPLDPDYAVTQYTVVIHHVQQSSCILRATERASLQVPADGDGHPRRGRGQDPADVPGGRQQGARSAPRAAASAGERISGRFQGVSVVFRVVFDASVSGRFGLFSG